MTSSPRPVVVDASALLELLLRGAPGQAVEQALGDSPMVAPHHIDVEILNALRGLVRSGQVDSERADEVVADLTHAPLERADTRRLLPLIWGWRNNLSAYDGAYAALAAVLECALVTADRRLGKALAGAIPVVAV